ncbi:MAG: pyridoxal-phosphate dependent enzyme, partial [Ferruginibacter sp.]
KGEPISIKNMNTMADGIAVGKPGEINFKIIQALADGIETVSEKSLAGALLFLLERAKLVVEPAGAVTVAHLLDKPSGFYSGPLVSILSGGNIDPVLLMRIIRHGMASEGRYMHFRVRVPDKPGSLANLLNYLAELSANVLEVEHVRTSLELLIDEVEISIQIETMGFDHQEKVLAALITDGYQPLYN